MYTTTIKNKQSTSFINLVNRIIEDNTLTQQQKQDEIIYFWLLCINNWKAIIIDKWLNTNFYFDNYK